MYYVLRPSQPFFDVSICAVHSVSDCELAFLCSVYRAQLISSNDVVTCRGAAITPQRRHRHVLLHKPAGHLSTRREVRQLKGGGFEEDGRPTVYDLLDGETQARHCMAVGRLDVDTTGALLFTSS